jgi:hypothetical protein
LGSEISLLNGERDEMDGWTELMEHPWDEEEEDEEEEEELLAWDGEGHVQNDETGDGEERGMHKTLRSW